MFDRAVSAVHRHAEMHTAAHKTFQGRSEPGGENEGPENDGPNWLNL